MILTVTLNASIDKRYVVEDYRIGEVNRVKECSYTAGGKGLNVSKNAVIAGEKVAATGYAGGHAGEYITEQARMLGIRDAFIRVAGESRSCINIYDTVNRTQTEFLEPGMAVTAESEEELKEQVRALMPECDVVAMSGSIPKGSSPDIYQELTAIAKAAGRKVIVDTSGKLLEGVVAAPRAQKPTMIKPNIDEIRALTGKSAKNLDELVLAAKALYESGIEVVAISLGGDGSLLVCAEGCFRAQVPKINAVNTVGCGDSMIAGFAAGMARGLSMEETLRLASAISAANAMREETGFFVKEDMEALYPQIMITRL
ncbi:MAG: 1-phosphofructokinase [Lachnospiraceae bacterium]|nr:1-phosphofructokinase [Lachnospiraceae bacterium]